MSNLQGNNQYNKPDLNFPSNMTQNKENSNYSVLSQQQDGNNKILSQQGTIKGIQISSTSDSSQGGIVNNDNYQKSTASGYNSSNNRNKGQSGVAGGTGGGGSIRMDSSNAGVGYNNNQIKQQQLFSQTLSIKEDDPSNNQHHQINLSNKQHQSQQSQGQNNMDIENSQNNKTNQYQNQNTTSSSNTGASSQTIAAIGTQQQKGSSYNTVNQGQADSTSIDPSLVDKQTPAISRIFAQDVIINFKKHLQDKWKKNKAKQHVNKIIHYHVQHTFFLRYAAPLFLKDYQELLNQNLISAGSNSNNREQGLLSTLKQINQDILNGSKKTKSVDVLQSYLTKLDEKDQLNQFLDVLVFILFGEIPYQIPSELNERKKNLFHYVSPIIAFLIIFYIHTEKKPVTLDELVTRSGLKQLYKNQKVPSKDTDMDDPNGANANDSDEDEDDEMIDEDGDSALQNSGPQNQNTQHATSKQQASNTSQQQSSSSQKNSSQGNSGTGLSLKKKNSSHPNNNDGIKNEDDEGQSNQEDKSQSGVRSTPQFLDLEKTLMQQKQQLSQQIHNSSQSAYSNQNSNNSSMNNSMHINIQKKNSIGNNSGNMILGQQSPHGIMQSQAHHHHHHHHHSLNQNSSKGINSNYQAQSQQNKQLTNSQQLYYNKQNMNPGNYQLNH